MYPRLLSAAARQNRIRYTYGKMFAEEAGNCYFCMLLTLLLMLLLTLQYTWSTVHCITYKSKDIFSHLNVSEKMLDPCADSYQA